MDEQINSKESPLSYCGCWNSLLISWQHLSLKLLPTSINSLVTYSVLNSLILKYFLFMLPIEYMHSRKKWCHSKPTCIHASFFSLHVRPPSWVPSVFSLLYKAYPTCKYYLKCHLLREAFSVIPVLPWSKHIPPAATASYICLMSYILWYAFIW